MSAAARTEEGFLKLVYPKGRVELHKHPITAAEVLERNPRCCVTRPDVFKYPWIVVSPESVLPLNRVFFIVPLRTIHRLLKEHGMSPSKQIRLRQQQQEEAQQQPTPNGKALVQNAAVSRQLILPRRKTCRSEESFEEYNSETENSETRLSKSRSLVEHSCKSLIEPTVFHPLVRGQNVVSSQKNVNHEPSECGHKKYESQTRTAKIQFNDQEVHEKHKEPHNKQYPEEHWPKIRATRKHQQQELEQYDSGCIPFRRNKDSLVDTKCVDHVTKLKPCLKSNHSNSPRSSSRLNVSFNIPDNDGENGNQKFVIYKQNLDSLK